MASSRRRLGSVNRLACRFRQNLGEAEKVAGNRRSVGIRPPEIDEIGHRLQGLAPLPQELTDPCVLEIAGLDQPSPDDHRALVFIDVAVGLTDDEQLIEAENQVGGLLLDHLEVLNDLACVVFLDGDEKQHAGRILAHVVAQGIAGEKRLQSGCGFREPSRLELGLASRMELVGRWTIGVCILLARRQHPELACLTKMVTARLVGTLHPGRHGPELAGKIAVDVVLNAPRVLLGRKVKRQHAIGQRIGACRGDDRSFNQGRSGGKLLLDDQEITLPLGCRLGNVSPDDQADACLSSQINLCRHVFKRGGVERDAEPGG